MAVVNHFRSMMGRLFPEREIYVRSQGSVRYITLGSGTQAAAAAVAASAVAIGLFSVAQFLFGQVGQPSGDDAVHAMYQSRIERMTGRYERLEAELEESERRFDELMARIADAGAGDGDPGVQLALQNRLETSRRRLRDVTQQRDATLTRLEELRLNALEMERRMAEAKRLAAQRQASLNDFVATLDSTVGERDEANERARSLAGEVDDLNERVEDIRTHQAQVMAQLEEAVRESMAELDSVLQRTGVDVDGLLKEIERTYSGEGGPFIPMMYRAPEAARGFPVNEDSVATILDKLGKLNAMRIAIDRLPLQKPITAPYRLSSGFGPRRHPITGKWSRHNGMDMAAPRGTPVYSPVGGVVTFAGVQRGYGKVVKIRHSLGYETVYAHLSAIDVTKGESVGRMGLVGKVGSTGRSTGNHLHYEIRRYSKPLNPRKFIEAGRNVF